jgi:hypothetical protein
MDYQLENLGPEVFQYLVQALVVKEYPHVQCFPVAQPDGGRDVLSIRIPNARAAEAEMVVFQVKFSRNPWAKDEHKELEKLLKDEAPKIKKLLSKGVKEFVLVTNIPGTAHLDRGNCSHEVALGTKTAARLGAAIIQSSREWLLPAAKGRLSF